MSSTYLSLEVLYSFKTSSKVSDIFFFQNSNLLVLFNYCWKFKIRLNWSLLYCFWQCTFTNLSVNIILIYISCFPCRSFLKDMFLSLFTKLHLHYYLLLFKVDIFLCIQPSFNEIHLSFDVLYEIILDFISGYGF